MRLRKSLVTTFVGTTPQKWYGLSQISSIRAIKHFDGGREEGRSMN